eukprot:3756984-Rhodomonas_salina.1
MGWDLLYSLSRTPTAPFFLRADVGARGRRERSASGCASGVFSVQCSVLSTQHSARSTQHSAFGVQRSAFREESALSASDWLPVLTKREVTMPGWLGARSAKTYT